MNLSKSVLSKTCRLMYIKKASTAFSIVWLYLVIIAIFIILQDDIVHLSIHSLVCLSSVAVILATISVVRFTSRGILSIPSIYIFVLILFHHGLIVPYALGCNIDKFFDDIYQISWFYSSENRFAIYAATLRVISMTCGILVCSLVYRSGAKCRIKQYRAQMQVYVGLLGFVVVVGSIIIWFAISLLSGGLQILTTSYMNFRESTEGTGVVVVYNFLGFGLACLNTSPQKQIRYVGYGTFFLWSLCALGLGIRSGVMFPLAVLIILRARRGIIRNMSAIIIIVFIALIMISLVRQIRSVGISQVSVGDLVASPVAGIVEMGGSLRPLALTKMWVDSSEGILNGAGYWAPFERALARFVPWIPRIPAEDDYRLSNVAIMERNGPYGYSIIAEAYRNFGTCGVVVILFALGLLLQWLDNLVLHWNNDILIAIILSPLLVHIRNAFAFVPAYIIGGLLSFYLYKYFVELLLIRKPVTTLKTGRKLFCK